MESTSSAGGLGTRIGYQIRGLCLHLDVGFDKHVLR